MATKKKTVTRSPKAKMKKAASPRKRIAKAQPKKAAVAVSKSGYNPQAIEPKWQKKWDASKLYRSKIDPNRKKFYALTMLPYPSGDLHIGHWYAMTPSDARARFMRMKGYNVMFPMGFDAFGLPAENAAIKRGIHPKKWTYKNIANMRKQMKSMGAMFDWEREAVSCDPEYYKWSQWFFTQMFKNGLAYKKMSPVDWCPNCNTTLAREQVWGEDRHCERCGTPVIKKDLEQWYFKITKYCDELLSFDSIDWPQRVKDMQTNWVGKSEGASVQFPVNSEQLSVKSSLITDDLITIFTTRPDTLWGATFMVLAPEHPLVAKLTTPDRKKEVEKYIADVTRRTDIEREATDKEKTGVFIGAHATNPVNGAKIQIWIADYVLMTYGTGAIMAVPAHDKRDFEFALKFGLPITPVIDRNDGLTKSFALGGTMNDGFAEALKDEGIPFEEKQGSLYITIQQQKAERYMEIAQKFVKTGKWNEVIGTRWAFVFSDGVMNWDSTEAEKKILARCHEYESNVRSKRTLMEMVWAVEFYRDALYHDEYGTMIHSGEFNGTKGDSAKRQVIAWLEKKGIGRGATTYRLRDWLISRQRYWGAPIPIVYCPDHGQVAVPDDQLPVTLPDKVEWKPTGESPLKLHPTWAKAKCPTCGKPSTRDTDTMDTFMCSSWYHLRYLSPKFAKGAFDEDEYNYWMPVDVYTGGIEHATMHLIYTRFFHKALRDMGITEGHEPMMMLRNQGMVLGEGSEKMSKSKGNVVAPDELVAQHGADAVRAYLMFFAEWEQGAPWNSRGIEGTVRWLNRVWTVATEKRSEVGSQRSEADERALRRVTHQTIKRVTTNFENFKFNTIISALMEMSNNLQKYRETTYGSAAWDEAISVMLRLMAPVTPHIAEELWAKRKGKYSIHTQPWPEFDPDAAAEEEITLVLQVNGKVRDRIMMPAGISKEEAEKVAMNSEVVKKYLEGKTPKKVVYVEGKLVNVAV